MSATASGDYALYLDYILTIKQFFNRHRSGGYMFAVSYAYSLKKEVNKEVIEYCRGQNLLVGEARIEFSKPSTPVQQLSEAKKDFRDGLILTNIDELMLLTQQEFVYQLNQMREALFALHIPILIWLTPENHSAFTHKAIDLYTRRDLDTLFFPEIKIENNNPILERSEMQLGQTEDAETLRTRIFLLDKQLQSARNDDIPRARIAKEIVLPLIKAYRQLLLFEPVNALITEFKNDFKEDDREALVDFGQFFYQWGNLDAAIQYFEKALQVDLKNWGEESGNVGFDYNELALAWRDKRDLDKAISYFDKALAIGLNITGEESDSVAAYYNNLGTAWKEKGNLDKAISQFDKALAINLKLYREDNVAIATVYNNLGSAWQGKGDLNKAISYFDKALAIDIQLYGEENPNVAIRYNNLGYAWIDKGDKEKAIGYFTNALAIDSKLLGEEHPKVGIRYNNLGSAWDANGDLNKAEEYYKKSIAILTATYGSDNHYTKMAQQNLDMLLAGKSSAAT